MSSYPEGPSRNDGPETTKSHSSKTQTSVEDKNNNEQVRSYPTSPSTKTQSTMLSFFKSFVTEPTHSHVNAPNTTNILAQNLEPESTMTTQLPTAHHHQNPKQSHHPQLSTSTSTSTSTSIPLNRARHTNPYKPHRRLRPPLKISSTLTARNEPASRPVDTASPNGKTNAAQPQKTQSTTTLTTPNTVPIPNPYKKTKIPATTPLTEKALHYCPDPKASSSLESDSNTSENISLASLSVRRTRSRLVYRPDRLQYLSPGIPGKPDRPLLLPGLDHLSEEAYSEAISTLGDIISLQSQLQECDQTSRRLLSTLNQNEESLSTQPGTSTVEANTPHLAPIQSIYIPQCSTDTSGHEENSDTTSRIMNDTPATYIHPCASTQSISDISKSTRNSTTHSTDEETDETPRIFPTEHDSHSTESTVRSLPSSTVQSTCTIDKFQDQASNSLFMDDFRSKHEGDFRLVLQNTRDIKEFKNSDPEYFPTVQALREGQCDLMCFVETNVPWHRNDLLYDVSIANKCIWPTPTKTIAASCRSENNGSKFYQPGGVMNIVANNLTTKIQSTSSDFLGRWTKIRLFAKKGCVVVYTVYWPNPSTLVSAGVNSSWMQQYRHLSSKDKTVDPRQKLILDLNVEILTELKLKSHIIVLGDFNEDLGDKDVDGIKLLMSTTGLVQAFQDLKSHVPSTRGNNRAIDHVFMSATLLPYVSQAGLVPEELCFASDHIALFLDINPRMLDTNNTPIPPAPNRKLKMHNVPNVNKYIKAVVYQMKCQNIINRLKNIDSHIEDHGFDDIATNDLEKVDATMTQIMLKAENDLAPGNTKYAFSAELLQQMRRVRLIKTFIRQNENNYPLESFATEQMEDEAMQLMHLTLPELEKKLIEERELLITMQDNSWDIRTTHHDDRIQAAAKEENKDVLTKIKEMKEREKQSRIYAHIGSALKNKTFGTITRLGLPKEVCHSSTEIIWGYISSKTQAEMKKIQWHYIEDPQEIERRLVEWNILHFNQASETPLANEKWRNKLDPSNKTDEELDEILRNKLTQDVDLCPTTRCFLEQIQSNIQQPMPKSMTKMTQEQFCDFYRKTPEDKAASPSGLHLGHYKAATKNDDFSYAVWKIMTLAYTNTYCLKRWRVSATTLLEKIHGLPWIHKFRTIHIVESDLNYVMRSIWGREFMHYNENNNSFHDNQYGGRRGRQPQSAILNKILSLEIIRHYGNDAAIVDNDAKACYDRIIPYLTTYMLRRLGMPYFLSRFMCNVLKQMKYCIRLPQGQSTTYTSTDTPLYGTGQGAGWSPPCWAVNSDIISCSMGQYTPGLLLTHPNNITSSHRHLDVFVDDTSLGVTQDAINMMQNTHATREPIVPISTNIQQQIQNNMSFYNALLNLTGGALAWEKCKAYILQFHWQNGFKYMKKTKDMYPALEIPDIFSEKFYNILLANPEEAFKMLGAFVAPDGNVEEQVKILVKQVSEWAEKLNRSFLTPTEALVAYTQVLFPSIIYPVAVLALTEAQCDRIISPAINALLKKLNLPKTSSRLLLYGPARYGGLNLPNLYVQGYIMKIMMIIGHWQKSDTTSTILDIVLGTSQQKVGINVPILESNYSKYSALLDDGWIKKVWGFLYEMHGSIVIKNIWTPTKIFQNDMSIMEKVLEMNISVATVKQINLCRLHKQVHQITDLLDSQNKYLHNDILNPTVQQTSLEKSPNVEVPKRFWKTWEMVVKTIYQSKRVSGFYPGKIVDKRAGAWLQCQDYSHILRYCGKNQYIKYYHVASSRNCQVYTRTNWNYTSIYALDIYKIIKVYEKDGKIFTDGHNTSHPYRHIQDQSTSTPPYQSFYRYFDRIFRAWKNWNPTPKHSTKIRNHFQIDPTVKERNLDNLREELIKLDPTLQRNLGIITKAQNLALLANSMEIGEVIAVSDASVGTRARASHSYILTAKCRKGTIQGSAPVDCDVDDIESTRAEMYGSVALHTIIEALATLFAITSGEVELYGDNKDSLCKIPIRTNHISFPRFFRPNVDLKIQICEMRENLKPIKIIPIHIKAHQDDDKSFVLEKASLPVRCNIEMDSNSKEFLKNHQGKLEPKNEAATLPSQKSYLCVQDTLIQNNIEHHIRLHFFGPKLENRFREKHKLSKQALETIHWAAIDRAYKKLPLQDKIATYKLLHKKWTTYMEIASWNCEADPICKRCNCQEETFNHIFQCKSKHAVNSHKQASKKLRDAPRRAKTAPLIQRAVMQCIQKHRKGYENLSFRDVMVSSENKQLAQNVFFQQEQLGHTAFMQGILSRDWVLLQNVYDNKADVLDYQIDWTAKIIRAIWKYSITMWRDRCGEIHGNDGNKSKSIHRKVTIRLLEKELERTENFGEFETMQLRRNIRKSMGNAQTESLQTWLEMIRNVKESKILRRRVGRIPKTRMQSITRFMSRTADA